ncbi:hypothetical protein ACKI1H_07890 [Pseudomonas sp. YH-1]|uniref:hypothetical protein n=1 Tax=Pseudomonas sp. YH-1 TaxID=3384787 RepID=UPI003F7F51ED
MNLDAPEQLRTTLEVTNDVLAAFGSAADGEQEQRTSLEIANDLLECMEAEVTQIMEMRSILLAVWRDPEATAHIKNLVGAGINASHFVSKGLEVLAISFREELAALEQPDQVSAPSDVDGGEA